MYASTPITPEKNNKFEHMTIEIWRSDNFLFLASGGCEIFGKKISLPPVRVLVAFRSSLIKYKSVIAFDF